MMDTHRKTAEAQARNGNTLHARRNDWRLWLERMRPVSPQPAFAVIKSRSARSR